MAANVNAFAARQFLPQAENPSKMAWITGFTRQDQVRSGTRLHVQHGRAQAEQLKLPA